MMISACDTQPAVESDNEIGLPQAVTTTATSTTVFERRRRMHMLDGLEEDSVVLPQIPFDVAHEPLTGMLLTVTSDEVAVSMELIAAHRAAVEDGWPRTENEYLAKKRQRLEALQPDGKEVIATDTATQSLSEALRCTKCPGPAGIALKSALSKVDFTRLNQTRHDREPVAVLAIDRKTSNEVVKRVLLNLSYIEVETVQFVVRDSEGKQRRLTQDWSHDSSPFSWHLKRHPEYPCANVALLVHRNAAVVKAGLPHRQRILNLAPYKECLYCKFDEQGNELALKEPPEPDWADSAVVFDRKSCPVGRDSPSRKTDIRTVKALVEQFDVPRCAQHRLYRREDFFHRPTMVRAHNSLSFERVVAFISAAFAAGEQNVLLDSDFYIGDARFDSEEDFRISHCKQVFELSRQ
jgi:hypothetical protein